MSFLVAGAPRSGTMAAARLLNTSPSWTVKHQTDTKQCALGHLSPNLFERFQDRDHYGEVNGGLLLCFHVVPVDCKTLIIRDPRECLVSAYNYWKAVPNADYALFDRAELTWHLLDNLMERERWFRYSRIFGEAGEFREFAEFLGVKDLPTIDLSVRHNTKPQIVSKWEGLPAHIQERGAAATDWFKTKWDV